MNIKIDLPLFDEVSNELARLDLYVEGSECHGAMCGYLSANRGEHYSDWFNKILLPMSEAVDAGEAAVSMDVESSGLIAKLFEVSVAQLHDDECGMRLLLPSDDELLCERVEALAEWCHGFLYALTVMASEEVTQYSVEAQEIISDFVKISQSGLESGKGTEEDEVAYAEIVEYVRIGALLIWSDARQLQRKDTSSTLH